MTPPSAVARRPLPGHLVRLLLAAATAVLLLSAFGGGLLATPLRLALVAGLVGLAAGFPASPAPAVAAVVAVVAFAAVGPGIGVQLVVVASLLHTVHMLAGLAEAVPARAVVELPAVLPTLGRWARAQLLTVPVLVALAAVLD